jgi:hypothetical protein
MPVTTGLPILPRKKYRFFAKSGDCCQSFALPIKCFAGLENKAYRTAFGTL